MFNTSPAFNLKVVLKETGIAADTLRAWERRYGLPLPKRTGGGHRLYSQRDIEIIKWLMKQQGSGLSISRAVDLWNEQIASGADPLAGSAPSTLTFPQATRASTLPFESTLDTMRSHWIDACLNFNETNAEQILNEAFSMFPIEAVCAEILQKGLSEVGAMWYENRASVQQEHFASGLAMRRLDALLISSAPAARAETILVGCPADEWHTFTPLLLSLFLRRRGFNVIYLGANVPADRFAETVQAVRANLVILASQTLLSAASLQQTALILTQQNVRIAFGGRIFNLHPELQSAIPGHHLGNDVDAALDEVGYLLAGKPKSREVKPPSQADTLSHKFFTAKRTEIEQTLQTMINTLGISSEGYRKAVHYLGDNIAAALKLGDIRYVSDELSWVTYLLQTHAHPEGDLVEFMEAYAKAVEKHINGAGCTIHDWLKEEAQKLRRATTKGSS